MGRSSCEWFGSKVGVVDPGHHDPGVSVQRNMHLCSLLRSESHVMNYHPASVKDNKFAKIKRRSNDP
jgi:hypothetical protein